MTDRDEYVSFQHTAKDKKGGGGTGKWHAPSQDSHGHSARVDFRCIPTLKRDIQIALKLCKERGLSDWRTEADFWRWAGVYLLDFIAKELNENEFTENLTETHLIIDVLAAEEQNINFKHTMDMAEKYVGLMKENGKDGEDLARGMLRTILRQIKSMPGKSWQGVWLHDFERRFRQYIGPDPVGVSLLPEYRFEGPNEFMDDSKLQPRSARAPKRKK